jgi:hypothetical protein
MINVKSGCHQIFCDPNLADIESSWKQLYDDEIFDGANKFITYVDNYLCIGANNSGSAAAKFHFSGTDKIHIL